MWRLVARRNQLLSRGKIISQNKPFSTITPPENDETTRPAPPPIQVKLTESAGRGVFATRRIGTGELIHTAKPVVGYPSLSKVNTVCYFCLRKLASANVGAQTAAFCCENCEKNAKVFYDVEMKADWQAFDNYCQYDSRFEFPLMLKRLACMVISGAASAEILDILQPGALSREMIVKMEKGCYLLQDAFAKANVADEQTAFLTREWYTNVLARIRINAFRVELALGGSYEDLFLSASSCVEAEDAVGNAIYMLPSFYNHDCDPNAHIIWIENSDARLNALRDIEEDEELRICYIDASMDRDARQSILLQGFGFKCNCIRCSHGD